MNSGTFYLYEYENNKRRRNVGFIKASRHYRSCILQIHANGIPVGNGASLELYAFYRDGADLIAEQIAVLNCFRRNISARLPIAESHFPEGRPLTQIDGFFIRLPGSRSALFWMASAFFFDVDMSRVRIASSENATSDNAPSESSSSENAFSDSTDSAGKLPAANSSETEETRMLTNTPQPEEASAPADILTAEESPEESAAPAPSEPAAASASTEESAASAPSEPAAASASSKPSAPSTSSEPAAPSASSTATPPSGQPSAKKIQRSDIAQLPRRFWPLANNSFLLHGYHNYNHLMLIEDGGRTWLGVPGTYDPQEARAADLFGFPRFTRSCSSFPELTAEERSDSGDFGHWCRCVGNCPLR